MRLSDQPALQRIDSAYHAPFLAACASALREVGLLSDIEAEELRILLKDRHRGKGESSLFSTLLREKNSPLTQLQAHFGLQGLSSILFRWTTARALEDLNLALWSFAQDLIKKAELMFNQNFYLYEGEHCERRTLFSFFLVELATEIHASADQFHGRAAEFRKLTPAGVLDLSADAKLEETLAQHLGFAFEDRSGLQLWNLQKSLGLMSTHLELLGKLLEHTHRQLGMNLELKDEGEKLSLLLDDWVGNLGQLNATSIYWPASLEIMETKRLRLLGTLINCKELIMGVNTHLLESLKTSRIKNHGIDLWPEAEKREVMSRLMARGHGLAEAELALESLQSYCRQHQLAPQQLLDAELQRIDPRLDEGALQILKKMTADKGVGALLQSEKHIVLQRKESLVLAIQERVSSSLIVLLLAFSSLLGCGVKTAPRSDVLDLKPSVPYHAEQRAYPKKTPKAVEPPPKS